MAFVSVRQHLGRDVLPLSMPHTACLAQLHTSTSRPPRQMSLVQPSGRRPFRHLATPGPRRALHLVTKASADNGAAPQGGRNLLVAIDSSQDSHYACEWMVKNVYRPGDTIHVCHCIPYFPRSGIYVMPDGRLATLDFDVLLRNEDQFLMAAEKAVADWCADVLESAQVRYVVDLLREQPGAEDKEVIGAAICKKAQELQAGVLVIASQAKSGLSEFFMGSVANYCAHHCSCPTLVLHRPKGGPSGGLGSWLPKLLQPKVKAEAVGAAAAAAGVAGSTKAGSEEAAGSGAQQQHPAAESGSGSMVGSEDLLTESDDNLLGQTADFPWLSPTPGASGLHAAAGAGEAGAARTAGAAGEEDEEEEPKRHIVMTVDDSDASEHACMWALQNLYRRGDLVTLLHVIPAAPYRATYGGPVMDGFVFYMDIPTDDFKKATELYVGKRFVPKLEALGVPYRVEIFTERSEDSVEGIGRAICRRVEELPQGRAVVVVGSHTKGGLAEFMLGSLATYLTHHCSQPVAVLH